MCILNSFSLHVRQTCVSNVCSQSEVRTHDWPSYHDRGIPWKKKLIVKQNVNMCFYRCRTNLFDWTYNVTFDKLTVSNCHVRIPGMPNKLSKSSYSQSVDHLLCHCANIVYTYINVKASVSLEKPFPTTGFRNGIPGAIWSWMRFLLGPWCLLDISLVLLSEGRRNVSTTGIIIRRSQNYLAIKKHHGDCW
jgi:hypothetical protein